MHPLVQRFLQSLSLVSKRTEPYSIREFLDRVPRGHVPPKRTRRHKALIATRQVWVLSLILWQIVELRQKNGKTVIVLHHYGIDGGQTLEITEHTLRQRGKVYEDAVISYQKAVAFNRAHPPTFDWDFWNRTVEPRLPAHLRTPHRTSS